MFCRAEDKLEREFKFARDLDAGTASGPFFHCSDICYGDTPMPPMGHARHPLGGIGAIPKGLRDYP